jgi:RNA polymerase sigma-70 factor (ECF subfamily)
VKPQRREDIEAFVRAALEHQRAVFAAAYAILRNRQDAEDITQDVFVEAYRNAHTLDNPEKLLPWLYKVATFRCREHVRKRARRERREATYAEGRSSDSSRDPLADEDRRKAIMSAIDALPQELRTVFMLRHFARMSYAEISKMTDLSETTIDGRLRTAKKKLRETLADIKTEVD